MNNLVLRSSKTLGCVEDRPLFSKSSTGDVVDMALPLSTLVTIFKALTPLHQVWPVRKQSSECCNKLEEIGLVHHI